MRRPGRVDVQLAILVFALMVVAWESYQYPIGHQVTWNEQPNLAADFSAFYNGAWAFFNNPDNLYAQANYPVPHGQTLVYPPQFLLFVIPLLPFSFPTAELIFSSVQFALLPLMAAMIYLVFRPKSGTEYALTAGAIEIALLEPFDSRGVGLAIWPQIEQSLPLLIVLPLIPVFAFEALAKSRKISILSIATLGVMLAWLSIGSGAAGPPNYSVNSEPYGTQWLLGQSKVLQLALILLAVWLAGNSPVLSVPVLALSLFDPRFTLVAFPLYFYIILKNGSLKKFAEGAAIAALLFLVPLILYHGVFEQYVVFTFNNYLAPTGYRRYFTFYFFDYDWLPFYALVAFQVGFATLEILRYRTRRAAAAQALSLNGMSGRP